ncbi:aminoglycoside phosphotransferase family protein [Paeniglutamicibacter gangotriensis]|uniref:Aminoglycoside phosphotransferase family protein n=1 Tax=Paeniglutamicibacter gangotriensis TaxID=254787 RepID=A0A5B0EG36_9MICC|nr:aminoglycoside phosphotransferase family protein [Paeniglutamicibacter gangotriensis]KAA0977628.1 aminoglycoside phosphotransferase family protein [Paeniglutamicibacter gangotriensis]
MQREATTREIELATTLHPAADWNAAHVDTGGQFHEVLVAPGEAVMRMSRTPEAAAAMQRRVDLIQALEGQFSFLLPSALGRVWHDAGFSAVIQRYVPGAAHLPHAGDITALRGVLAELAAVDLGPLEGLLAPPFTFGGPWTPDKIESTLEVLPQNLAVAAQQVLDAVDSFAEVPASLVHGDLAGHNMRWREGKLLGVIDWDLAAAWDPALNTAYLASWHGHDFIEAIAPSAQEAWRARIWLGAMGLESVFDASLDPQRDLSSLISKIAPRLFRAAEVARG